MLKFQKPGNKIQDSSPDFTVSVIDVRPPEVNCEFVTRFHRHNHRYDGSSPVKWRSNISNQQENYCRAAVCLCAVLVRHASNRPSKNVFLSSAQESARSSLNGITRSFFSLPYHRLTNPKVKAVITLDIHLRMSFMAEKEPENTHRARASVLCRMVGVELKITFQKLMAILL